jgi:hypothetical protein
MLYQEKYLKYKNKYLNLKQKIGGNGGNSISKDVVINPTNKFAVIDLATSKANVKKPEPEEAKELGVVGVKKEIKITTSLKNINDVVNLIKQKNIFDDLLSHYLANNKNGYVRLIFENKPEFFPEHNKEKKDKDDNYKKINKDIYDNIIEKFFDFYLYKCNFSSNDENGKSYIDISITKYEEHVVIKTKCDNLYNFTDQSLDLIHKLLLECDENKGQLLKKVYFRFKPQFILDIESEIETKIKNKDKEEKNKKDKDEKECKDNNKDKDKCTNNTNCYWSKKEKLCKYDIKGENERKCSIHNHVLDCNNNYNCMWDLINNKCLFDVNGKDNNIKQKKKEIGLTIFNELNKACSTYGKFNNYAFRFYINNIKPESLNFPYIELSIIHSTVKEKKDSIKKELLDQAKKSGKVINETELNNQVEVELKKIDWPSLVKNPTDNLVIREGAAPPGEKCKTAVERQRERNGEIEKEKKEKDNSLEKEKKEREEREEIEKKEKKERDDKEIERRKKLDDEMMNFINSLNI